MSTEIIRRGKNSVCSSSTADEITEPEAKPIDIENEEHLKELMEWCEQHYEETIEKSRRNGNTISYHDCCLTFTRRRFTERSTHPKKETFSVFKLGTFKDVNSAKDLYEWLLKRIQNRHRVDRPAIFPSINMPHPNCDNQRFLDLMKQNRDLSNDYKDMSLKYSALLLDNQQLYTDVLRLKASSKNWHDKYQAILSKQETDEEAALFFGSPQKKLITLDDDNLFN
jgi:hypothetical protein